MKTVVILAGLVALTLAGTVPPHHDVKTKPVDADFVLKQKKILSLVHNLGGIDVDAEYYKIGKDYDIEAHINDYTNKNAVLEFLKLWREGYLPKMKAFSIFYERLREETIALFQLFYYAKDFETFYKTAAFARVHMNLEQFVYCYYVAIIQRDDIENYVLPPAYEIMPNLYVNSEVIDKMYYYKLAGGLHDPEQAKQLGVVKEKDYYVVYANYSDSVSYSHGEQRMSYLTEDIGWNSFYFYFHVYFPFWLSGNEIGPMKNLRGDTVSYFYQQLLARYYLERLSNGLGEIPSFSWNKPIKTGYTPTLWAGYPLPQRNNYYFIDPEECEEDLQFLEAYEQAYLQCLDQGHIKAYRQEVDLYNSKASNFVGNYWQSNADLYEKLPYFNYDRSYQVLARRLLGASPAPRDKHTVYPSALERYQTTLRDPMFYQLYAKTMDYIIAYKENLKSYTQDELHYVGVKIENVNVDRLVTYFDFYDFDASNSLIYTPQEYKSSYQRVMIRQPRLDHKPFSVSIDVKSDVDGDAVFKIYLGPKYDSNGYPIPLEENWNNFVELDWFVHKLSHGKNTITRNSEDFFFFRDDSIPSYEIFNLLDQGKVPYSMSEELQYFPNRLMLPKGTDGGYPYQLFVIVYPYVPLDKEYEPYKTFMLDNKPVGWPFDRPVYNEYRFKQPNMCFEDVVVYHEGEEYPYMFNIPGYTPNQSH